MNLDIGPDLAAHLHGIVDAQRRRSDWSRLPQGFLHDALEALKDKLRSSFNGRASNFIRARVRLSQADSFEEIDEAIDLLRAPLSRQNPSYLHYGPVSKGRFFGALCGAAPGDLAYITDPDAVTCPACQRALSPEFVPAPRVARAPRSGPTKRELMALRHVAVQGDREGVILLLAASRITGKGSRQRKERLTLDPTGQWRKTVRDLMRSTAARAREMGLSTTEVDEAIADRVAFMVRA